ncbi:MAG: peptide-methionine (R)-S-oxide reductase MsrB [Candidatus Kaiserbacteria bacterium]|nr:peptide-methionine (R)-S-oxide reductase MsrB [Candidatus Kaiserbacteria bacterium]
MDTEERKENLSEEAWRVTQEGATEEPFTNKYYKEKADGLYHCAVCDAKLFDSSTKFDSSSGWPSFYDSADKQAVTLSTDTSAGMERIEASCSSCGAHLGHVFPDAPDMPTGQRFCINSCSLSLKERNNQDSS